MNLCLLKHLNGNFRGFFCLCYSTKKMDKLEYKVIPKDRFEEVVGHLRDSFFRDEPLNKCVGLCKPGQTNVELENTCYKTLEDGVSIMALDKDNKIAGVELNGITGRGYYDSFERRLELCRDENYKKIFHFLNTVNKKANIYDKFEVDKVFDVRMLSVDGRYRGKGIASELVAKSEKLAKDCGFKIMKAEGTGIQSQKILKNTGFNVLEELSYNEYTDEHGNQVIRMDPPHLKLQLLYKQLK